MTGKKKLIVWIVVGVLIAALLGVGIFLLYSFLPRSMSIDWDSIDTSSSDVSLLLASDEHNVTGSPALVKKNKDGSFSSEWKVLQFTDMHLTHELKTTNNTIAKFIDTLNKEKPDFVVLTGDIVTRLGGKVRLKQLSEIFEKAGIYWAYVLGNHEGDSDPYTVSRDDTVRIVSEYKHCLTDSSVKKTNNGTTVWGKCNFVVNLLGEGYNIVQSMFFLDSGNKISASDYEKLSCDYPELEKKTYDFLKQDQLTWYEEQLEKVVNINPNVKTMLFLHIPLVEQSNLAFVFQSEYAATEEDSAHAVLLSEDPEFLDKMAMDEEDRAIAKQVTKEDRLITLTIGKAKYTVYPASFKKVQGSERIVGGEVVGFFVLKDGWSVVDGTGSYEKCYCSQYNSGMYDLMKKHAANVNGLFCGHDHINNTILYESAEDSPVYLCYGTCSGIQSYNLKDYGLTDGDPYEDRGYSVIDIAADGSFSFTDVLYIDGSRTSRIVASQPVGK